MTAVTVNVELGERSYPIRIQPHVLREVGPMLTGLFGSGRVFVVTDDKVGPLYATVVCESLHAAGFAVECATVPAGESSKCLRQAEMLYDRLLDFHAERSTPVLALGGGVVGDLAGFVAATWLRGIPLVMLPTTLLACVDSSVGGKVAVNHPRAKNVIGAFYQPRTVLIDPTVLTTLAHREFVSGISEVVKYGVILDREFFQYLELNLTRLLALDTDVVTHVIATSCRLKADVVAGDETESGRRMILNYGHTFAHALETVAGYGKFLHGEAVAVGMDVAARIAAHLGMIDESLVLRQERLLRAAGLSVAMGDADSEEILSAMTRDKKVRGGRVRFVLPERLGHVVVRDDVPTDVVRAVLAEKSND